MTDEAAPEKDWPLYLRRRRDGTLVLTEPTGRVSRDAFFPKVHEFSTKWLLENSASRVASMDAEHIYVTLGNATATYTIDRARMEETKSRGYWGVLEASDVFDAPEVDYDTPEAPLSEGGAAVLREGAGGDSVSSIEVVQGDVEPLPSVVEGM